MSFGANEFSPNYVEHLVPLMEKGRLIWKKLGLVAMCALLVIATLAVAVVFPFVTPMVPVFLILVTFLTWFLWRYVSVEYEYQILHGEIRIDVVYGRRQRKHYYTAPIQKIRKLSPLNGKEITAQSVGADREVFAASRRSHPRTWYALVEEEGGSVTLLLFEVTEKAEKSLRFYNSRAFLSH